MKEHEITMADVASPSGEDGSLSEEQIAKMALVASGSTQLGDKFQIGTWTGTFDFIGIQAEASLYRTITGFMVDAETKNGDKVSFPDLISMYPDILMQLAVPILSSHHRQADRRGLDLPPYGSTPSEILAWLDDENTANLNQLMVLVFGTMRLQDTSTLLGKVFALVGTMLSVSMGAGAMKSSSHPAEPSDSP